MQAGYTLVELMIGLATVSVLAALATTGFQNHRGYAKSAEAKETVGSIGRAVAAGSYRSDATRSIKGDKSQGKGKQKGQGATVTEGVPGLCNTSVLVPDKLSKVTARQYQPSSAPGRDYQTGSDSDGWQCLRFQVTTPQHYQYRYVLGGPPISVKLPNGGSPNGAAGSIDREWTAYARGDTDGDGIHAWFVLRGSSTDREIKISTAIYEENGEE